MTTVFLSHSSKDNDLAWRIAKDLSTHDIKVWFDEWEIRIGESITQKIEQGLSEADFVAVLLTKHSVKSGWVEKEWHSKIGEEAVSGEVIILPLLAEIGCAIPSLLKNKRYANVAKDYSKGINDLVTSIKAYTADRKAQRSAKSIPLEKRVSNLPAGGVLTPCFFPSISGAAKNALSPMEHLEILVALGHPLFLVSAFDVANSHKKIRSVVHDLLSKAATAGQMILLDSGLYEKRWLRSRTWRRQNYHSILKEIPCHLAFSYDNPNPKGTVDRIVTSIVEAAQTDMRDGEMNAIIPVVHARYPKDFPVISAILASETSPPLIAYPERELGEGVIEIAQTIRSIRKAIDATGQDYPIHILGAGNPLSILIYSLCGADSFDGLDWCQTVVDHSSGKLFHTLQMDFFSDQTPFASQTRLPYLTRLFAHNLSFYEDWMAKIRQSMIDGQALDLIHEFIPAPCSSRIEELLSS